MKSQNDWNLVVLTNRELLYQAALKLKPLLGKIVFVGGCVTDILIDDPGAPKLRSTTDVDVIAEVTSYKDYLVLSKELRNLGFTEDQSEDAPICRWLHESLILDVMPTNAQALGFSNRWYAESFATAQNVALSNGISIQVINAACFLATKFEAYHGRSKGDVWVSHDLEDLVSVIDGRLSIVEDVQGSSDALRSYLKQEIRQLLANLSFREALPGFVESGSTASARLTLLTKRLELLSSV